MRNLKKVLTLVLALVMVVGCLAVGASAFTDDADIKYTDAVATNSALGVFAGYPEGNFDPKGDITRQEAAKIIAVALNGGSFDPTYYEDAQIFDDVDGLWGEGYINYLAGLKILAGKGNGNFDPQGKITAQELAKVLLVALGYPDEVFSGDTWANSVNRQANFIGLYKDYTGTYNKALTREEASLLIYNALTKNVQIATWSYNVDSKDGYVWTWTNAKRADGTNETFITKYFDCYPSLGFVTATSGEFTELTGTNVVVTYDMTGVTTKTTYKDAKNLTGVNKVTTFDGALGDAVTVYVNNKTKAVVTVADRTIDKDLTEKTDITLETTSGYATNAALKAALKAAGFSAGLLTDANVTDIMAVTGNGKDITLKQDVAGNTPVGYGAVSGVDTVDGLTVYVKTNSTFAPYIVSNVTTASYTLTKFDGSANVTVNKNAAKNTSAFYKYETLEKGLWYTVKAADVRTTVPSTVTVKYGSATPITNITPVTTVKAAVATAYGASTVTANGTVYALAALSATVTQTGELNSQLTAAGLTNVTNTAKVYALGNASASLGIYGVDLFLDPFGYIFAAVQTDNTVKVSDYAYIINADVEIKGSGSFETASAKVEVLTDDNVYAIYTLNFTKKADGFFYSGNYKLASITAENIETELIDNAFAYSVKDGVFTLVSKAVKTTNAAAYTVVSSKAAPASISLTANGTSETYLFNADTEFVYMDLKAAPNAKKSVAASTTLAGASTINNGTTVFYQVDSLNNHLITKIIVKSAPTSTAKDAYVFVDVSTMTAALDTTINEYKYTYATILADGTAGTITIKADNKSSAHIDSTDKVVALNKDGTVEEDSVNVISGTITSIAGTTLTITKDGGGVVYLTVGADVNPVLTADDVNYENNAKIIVSLNTAGTVGGIWIYK